MKNFVSVSTNAARFQDISLNPQKLAGMCAKLKCCLNYEVDDYVEASKRMPPRDAVLQTADNDYYQFKTDILAGTITYSTDKKMAVNLETISAARALTIIELNKQGEKPLSLTSDEAVVETKKSKDLLEGDINRFDKAKRKKNKRRGQRNGEGRPGKGTTQKGETPAVSASVDGESSTAHRGKSADNGGPAGRNRVSQRGENAGNVSNTSEKPAES